MSKLERCPLCGRKPVFRDHGIGRLLIHYGNGVYGDTKIQACHRWNRLARLVRKGRMFEWLERSYRSILREFRGGALGNLLFEARSWWRERRAKR